MITWKEAVKKFLQRADEGFTEVGEPEDAARAILAEVQTFWPPDQLASARTALIREARGEVD